MGGRLGGRKERDEERNCLRRERERRGERDDSEVEMKEKRENE